MNNEVPLYSVTQAVRSFTWGGGASWLQDILQVCHEFLINMKITGAWGSEAEHNICEGVGQGGSIFFLLLPIVRSQNVIFSHKLDVGPKKRNSETSYINCKTKLKIKGTILQLKLGVHLALTMDSKLVLHFLIRCQIPKSWKLLSM